MFKLDSKLTMACSAAVLALAMTACSSSDDDPPVASNVPEVVEPEVVEPSGPTNDQVAASQTALDAYSVALLAHTMAQTAYDADMSVANAAAVQMAATALQVAATAAHTAIEAGASDAQKEAFGDTAVADATAAVMSAGGAVTLATAIVVSQGALDAYAVTQTAHTAARAAYVADASVANATALQTAATALQAAAMAAHTAIVAGSTDAQKAAFGATAVADVAASVAEAAAFVIASRLAADEAADKLALTQADAATAAMDAATAARAAKVASEAAKTERENLATLQTGEKSGDLAHASYTHAKAAADAAMEAQKASDNAAAATDGDEATRFLAMAETARNKAVTAQGMAKTESEDAVTATMAELMIVGKVKSVGDTSITVGADNNVATTTSGGKTVTTETGEIGKVTATSKEVPGVVAVPEDLDEDPPVVEVVAKPIIDARSINIGVQLDSDDDVARLTLVTHYIGSATVAGVYFGTEGGTQRTIPQADHSAYDEDSNADTAAVQVKAARGLFYDATGVLVTDNVLPATKGTELHYYDATLDGVVTRTWLRRTSSETDTVSGDLSHHYIPYTEANVAEKLANFPMQTAYKHLHFGLWNSLSGSGPNEIADLGIGFVTATADGMGMTGSDMPAPSP